MPPRWAKWATPERVPLMPATSSITPSAITRVRAFIGIGGIISITRWLGNSMPKASSTPNTPPDAPSVGYGGPPCASDQDTTTSWHSPAPTTHTRK